MNSLKAPISRATLHRLPAKYNRTGGVLMIVMVVMIASALMASQGVRLMMLANSAHDQRMKSAQVNELLELGRQRLADLADQAQPDTFTAEVPSDNGLPPRVGQVTIEKKSNADGDWRIRVRFPYNQPQETTVTWESPS